MMGDRARRILYRGVGWVGGTLTTPPPTILKIHPDLNQYLEWIVKDRGERFARNAVSSRRDFFSGFEEVCRRLTVRELETLLNELHVHQQHA